MSEMPSSGYSLIGIPEPQQMLVHVHPGAEELGRVYRPALAINASPTAFVAALEGIEPPLGEIAWRGEARAANAAYRAWSTPAANAGPVQLGEIVAWLRGGSRRMRSSPTAPAIFRLGAPLLRFPPLWHAARADRRLDGLRPAGGDRGQAPPSRTDRWSPSPATAASS